MREINVKQITEAVKKISIESNCILPADVLEALKKALQSEESPAGRNALEQIIMNAEIARSENVPMCQDTGFACIFVEIGQDINVTGGNFRDAINEGVRQGYKEGYLRKSVVKDPLNRKNTGDNTPANIHFEIVSGDKIKISIIPKGGGSENMSAISMLPPSAGIEGVKKFILDTVKKAGSNPCPPIVVGVGIGGTFDLAPQLAKKVLLRKLDSAHKDPFYAKLEKELLEIINNTGIGPQGLGGRNTALAVLIENYPSHITGIPVAVNIQCHACRRMEVII